MKRRAKKFLCTAFAAAVMLGGTALAEKPVPDASAPKTDTPALTSTTQPPDIIAAFGAVARAETNVYDPQWSDMTARQALGMQDSKNAKSYHDFLSRFDRYAQEPLAEMAKDVNAAILKDITYNDKLYPREDYIWAAPVETVAAQAGNCAGIAILQYAVLRALGVPEDRLVMAVVNANGSRSGTDHAVLLLNVAAAGAAQDFLVLNDGGGVYDASLYARPQGADKAWPNPYVFYIAVNDDGVWMTPLGENIFLKKPQNTAPAPMAQKAAHAPTAQKAPSMQMAQKPF